MSDNCEICSVRLSFRWTDTHGVAVCGQCGAPYTVYHYHPETKEREDKPPAMALNEIGKALALRYWQEKRAMVWPAAFDMGFLRGDATYSGATRADESAFHAWLEKQPEAKQTEAA